MLQEIQEIIKKNLPQEVGDNLKQLLEQGKKDAELLKEYKDTLNNAQLIIKEKEEEISKYKKLNLDKDNLDKKRELLNERERELTIKMLQIELACEQDKSKFAKDVALGLVRNITYRENILDNKGTEVPYTDQYGNRMTQYVNDTQNSIKTKTIE